jgi:hypothetical protein
MGLQGGLMYFSVNSLGSAKELNPQEGRERMTRMALEMLQVRGGGGLGRRNGGVGGREGKGRMQQEGGRLWWEAARALDF